MKKSSQNQKPKIRITINGIRLDKLPLPLGSYFSPDGRERVTSLILGQNIKAHIDADILCIKQRLIDY